MNIIDKMKQGNSQIDPRMPKVSEKEYYIHPKLKKDLDGILKTMQSIGDFGTEMGHRNYILSGPPGVGKTLCVDYIATQMGYGVYDGKLVMNAQAISQIFTQLRAQAKQRPLLFLLNELDKFSSRDAAYDPQQQQTLNQLLDELDGSESNHGIYIFGTTNKPNNIDNALRRPKRFSKEIYFMPPDRKGRLEILRMHAEGKGGHKFKVDAKIIENAADVTYGYTGADLVGLLNEAFTNAALEDRTKITQEDLTYAMSKTIPTALKDMPFREAKTSFEDLGGYKAHIELLRRIVGNSSGSTLLFYGPKGTGKSTFPEALAKSSGYNFMMVSGSEPMDKFVGETGKMLDKYIDRAKQLAPCILVFDEMNALIENEGVQSYRGSWSGLLQSRLSRPIDGVYIIGTVNRPDEIKGAFRDRFVHKFFFGMPDQAEQREIWQKYLPKEIDAAALVALNPSLSCRDIARTCQMVRDYGLESTQEVYCQLVAGLKSNDDVDWQKIKEDFGDSVSDYARVKSLLGDHR